MESPNEVLNTISNIYITIAIELTNGYTFQDGKTKQYFTCNSSAVDEDNSGGFTAEINITKTGSLLTNKATVKIYGLPDDVIKVCSKLQSMTGLNIYTNWIEIYAGYELLGNNLPQLMYRGMVKKALPDRNNAQQLFTIETDCVWAAQADTNAPNIELSGDVLLTDLFAKIISYAPAASMYHFEPIELQGKTCTNPVYHGGSWYNMLKQACKDNNCDAPIIDVNVIYIRPKGVTYLKKVTAVLNKKILIGSPCDDKSGMSQVSAIVKFNGQLLFGQRVQIVGEEYDDVYRNTIWYINGMEIVLHNRGHLRQYQLSMGEDFYNIAQDSGGTSSTTGTITSSLFQDLTKMIGANSQQGAVIATGITPAQRKNPPKSAYINYSAATDLASVLDEVISAWARNVNTGIQVKIVKADNDKNLYTVKELGVGINVNGNPLQPRTITNVPAMFPPYTKYKLYKDDVVQLLTNQYDISLLKSNGWKSSYIKSPRRFNISDSVIIAKPQSLNSDDNSIILDKDNIEINFTQKQTFRIDNNTYVVIEPRKITLHAGQSETTLENGNTTIKCGLGQIKIYPDGSIDLGDNAIQKILTEASEGDVTVAVQVNTATGTGTGTGKATFVGKGSTKVKSVM